MRLYHFTARHHVEGGDGHAGPGILHAGVLPNTHPLIDSPHGLVWLTTDATWEQAFAPRAVHGVDCDRTEARITVTIPRGARRKLLTVDDILPFVRSDWRDDFTGGIDLSAWRAYRGRIPWAWTRGIAYRSDVLAVAS